jgi:hypothetical protein
MSNYAPTRRTFFATVTAFLFAGLVGKKLGVAAAPPAPPLPQPLATTCTLNYCSALPDTAEVVSINTYNYSGRLLSRAQGPGNTRTWIYGGTKSRKPLAEDGHIPGAST